MPGLRRLRLALVFGLCALPASAAEELADGIAAQVGNEIVLVSEVMRVVAPVETQARAQGATEKDIARLRADGLERLIEWRLIEQMVRQAELSATDEEIDATIASIAEANKLSIEALRESVTSHGLDYQDYRDEIKRELERRKAVGMMVGSRIQVEESEVRALYAERYAEQPEGGTTVHLRQILVTQGEEVGRSPKQACDTARAARARVVGGEPFELVASQVSDVAPERGGDIGVLHWDRAASWMQQVVAELEPGQLSDVVELPFGCGLLQLVERTEYQPVSYEQVKPRLEQEVYERHMAEEMSKWLDDLRKRTYIERKGYFAEAARFSQPSAEAPDPSLP